MTAVGTGRWAAGWSLAVVLVLSACSGVPGDGPVLRVTDSREASVLGQPDVTVDFSGPEQGQSPVDVVRGFLAASSTSPREAARAREFLDVGTRSVWAPTDSVVLDRDSIEFSVDAARPDEATGAVHVILRGTATGVLAANGVFTREYHLVLHDFRLVRNEAGWRIQNPPKALLVDGEDFRRVYRPVEVYFQAHQGRFLVPDRRFVAGTRGDLPRAVLDSLFAGPSSWLAPAVRPLPGGGVAVESVDVSNGEARVTLTAAAARLGPAQRSSLAAAIVWSLSGAALAGVRVESDKKPLASGAPEVMTEADWSRFRPPLPDPRPWFLVGGELRGPVGSGNRAGDSQEGIDEAAVDPTGRWAVATVPAAGSPRTAVVVDGSSGRRRAIDTGGSDISSPSYAADGRAFLVSDGREILRVRVDSLADEVVVPDAGYSLPREIGAVRQVRAASDGVRVAFVAGDADEQRVYTGVLVDGPGTGEVAEVREVATLYGVTSVAWLAETELVVIAAASPLAAPQPLRVAIDGSSVGPIGSAGLGETVTAMASQLGGRTLVVSGRAVLGLNEDEWEQTPNVPAGVRAPVLPGA